jgi:hypothetical protein
MPPLIIYSNGQAESGKNTCCDYIADIIRASGYSVAIVGLADRIKVISRHLIKLFYGLDVPLEEFDSKQGKALIRPEYTFNGNPLTLRAVLQQVGTMLKENIWSDIWCEYIERTYLMTSSNKKDVLIISDCRFPEEAEYFRSRHEHIFGFRVHRPSLDVSGQTYQHVSETRVNQVKVDVEIINDGTVEQLYQHLNSGILDNILF